MIPLNTHFYRAVRIRRKRSQTVHHGKEVVSFAAAAGHLVSSLGELAHYFSQFRVGLLVLSHKVIIVCYFNYTLLVLVPVKSLIPVTIPVA